jgi:hypothetical protein
MATMETVWKVGERSKKKKGAAIAVCTRIITSKPNLRGTRELRYTKFFGVYAWGTLLRVRKFQRGGR